MPELGRGQQEWSTPLAGMDSHRRGSPEVTDKKKMSSRTELALIHPRHFPIDGQRWYYLNSIWTEKFQVFFHEYI